MTSPVTKETADHALRSGRLPEAAELYISLCARNPEDASAWATLGDIHAALGQFDRSVEALQRAVALQPRQAAWWGNLGASQLDCGKQDEAVKCFHESLRLNVNQPGIHYNLGAALTCLGRLDEALESYRQALALRPDFAEAWLNLGSLHSQRREYPEAMRTAGEALRLRNGWPEAHNNLGQALASLDRHEEAVACYREALRLKPDYPEALSNLAASLVNVGLPAEATMHARRALELNSRFGEAANNLGHALIRLGEIPEAIRVLSAVPANNPAHAAVCDNRLLALNYDPAQSPEKIASAHREWGQRFRVPTPVDWGAPGQRRIRVGYLSPDFSSHSVAFFIEPVLHHHDRKHFEVTAYADINRADAVTQRLRSHIEHWREVHTLDDHSLATLIHHDEIDILVDLAGHLRHNRLRVFAERAAPVQITWLGYPNTTGLESMDFCISDEVLDPPGSDSLYTEKLIRLPDGFACYQPPDDAPPVAPSPVLENGYITFGAFHTLAKLNAPVIALWTELLQRLPMSRLRLQTFGLGEPAVRDRILGAFATHGIGAERIALHGQATMHDYLLAHSDVDIGLDTLPWSGHTTTCHALWMGVPTLTLAGDRHAGRLGASALLAADLPDMVARNRREWLDRTQALAGNPALLVSLRSSLRERMLSSALCNGAQFVKNLEAAYRSACAIRA